ncbi:thioredoxin family protein [Metarhizium robertsii]|uniref:Thioredoxin n=3 Tax=Metarhizium TaxID=5529 RepID=E9EKD3_METRA|nr:Thioredoxin-like fold protein [Metarhizium robertsii ARSEF 23]EFZ04331.1 Thioredoxin-like fold protein [Metarhizium robertsii ARSEF 23]EXU95296.1 thioredoxin family protein [Metarhizium robertsii]
MMIVVTSEEAFKELLSHHEKVAVDFSATWCGSCEEVSPKFEAMSLEYPEIVFCNVDIDQQPLVSEKAGVRSVPTFQAYLNGEKKDESQGADMAKLKRLVEELNNA